MTFEEEFLQKTGISFEAHYKIYNKIYLQMLFSYTRSNEDSLDIISESYIKAMRYFHNYKNSEEGGTKFTTWFATIMMNTAKMNYKLSPDFTSLEDETDLLNRLVVDSDDYKNDDDIIIKYDRVISIIKDDLTDEFRDILMLREEDGYSYLEIADILNISLSKVKNTIYNAKKSIYKIYINKYKDDPLIKSRVINQYTQTKKDFYEKNKDRMKEYNKKYREQNPDYFSNYRKEYKRKYK